LWKGGFLSCGEIKVWGNKGRLGERISLGGTHICQEKCTIGAGEEFFLRLRPSLSERRGKVDPSILDGGLLF